MVCGEIFLLDRLQTVESELRSEQAELQDIVAKKEKVINEQQQRIRLLESPRVEPNHGLSPSVSGSVALASHAHLHPHHARQYTGHRHRAHHHLDLESSSASDTDSDEDDSLGGGLTGLRPEARNTFC